jgi:hypothetical protein
VISFRYHVVTIVAVFLALAIGLLGGGAFVQPALQRELQNRTEALQQTTASLREQITELRAQTGRMGAFSDAALPYLTRDRLLGQQVVIVSQDGVDDTVLGEAQRALADAGAETVAVLHARDQIASTDPDTQGRLGQIIGHPTALAVDLPSLTAAALAERLSHTRGQTDPSRDLLDQLLSDGFLTSNDDAAAIDRIGEPGQVVVVLGGGSSDTPLMPPEDFGSPLVQRLVELGVPVAVGEGTDTPSPASLVASSRDGEGDAVVTVDDLDLSMGGAALVLAIDQLVDTDNGGAYGLKEGAEPLPPLP